VESSTQKTVIEKEVLPTKVETENKAPIFKQEGMKETKFVQERDLGTRVEDTRILGTRLEE
jgi:hypothetical protein